MLHFLSNDENDEASRIGAGSEKGFQGTNGHRTGVGCSRSSASGSVPPGLQPLQLHYHAWPMGGASHDEVMREKKERNRGRGRQRHPCDRFLTLTLENVFTISPLHSPPMYLSRVYLCLTGYNFDMRDHRNEEEVRKRESVCDGGAGGCQRKEKRQSLCCPRSRPHRFNSALHAVVK